MALFLARLTVPLPLVGTLSLHFVGALALAFALPSPLAALVSALALPRSNPFDPWREAFNRSQVGLATLLASSLFRLLPVPEAGVLLGGVAYFLVNLGAVFLLAWRVKGVPPRELWRRNFAPYGVTYLLVSPVAYLMVRLYETPLVGPWGGFGVVLVLLPLVYLRHMWLLKRRLEEASKRMLQGMVRSLEAKDAYTALHSERVAAIAKDLARQLGLSEAQQEAIYLGSLLHDIGKVGVPEGVLGKAGKLSAAEWSIMETHPEVGSRIVAPMLPYLGPVDDIIRYHHERYDGKGYPYGLRGEEIPLPARIVAVADAYEAMTSHRPYRKAFPVEVAVENIRKGAGEQFDPRVVEAFLQAVGKNPPWLDRDRFAHRTLEVGG